MAADAETVVRTSEPPHLRIGQRLRDVHAHRETLLNLVRKELKVKYAASVLGAVWSLLNPVVFLAVFTFVTRVIGNPLPDYPVYLLSGLLAWNLFSVSLTGGARSVIDNANLVKKVSFPREILPLAAIGVALVDYVLQTGVLLLFMVVTAYAVHLPELALFPLAFVTLLVFTTAMTLWMAALNVRYRDVQHLLNVGLLVWFWMTPIVYASELVQEKLSDRTVLGVNLFALYMANPLASIVEGLHRALYGVVAPVVNGEPVPVLVDISVPWLAAVLGIVLAASALLLRLTWGLYFRLSGDFAEEL
ncbi:MAG TPA: ABC transporter permease [Actinomycetota bacterium]|nr:ABC transporter permease [Actinomycetota bacterium]